MSRRCLRMSACHCLTQMRMDLRATRTSHNTKSLTSGAVMLACLLAYMVTNFWPLVNKKIPRPMLPLVLQLKYDLFCPAACTTRRAIFALLTLVWSRRTWSSTSVVWLSPSTMTTLAWTVLHVLPIEKQQCWCYNFFYHLFQIIPSQYIKQVATLNLQGEFLLRSSGPSMLGGSQGLMVERRLWLASLQVHIACLQSTTVWSSLTIFFIYIKSPMILICSLCRLHLDAAQWRVLVHLCTHAGEDLHE
jgi:hypothetical protein